MSLSKHLEQLKKADTRVWIKRVMWSSLDERIELVFNKVKEQDLSVFGGISISFSKNHSPVKEANLLSYQHINSTHIFTGQRLLGIKVKKGSESKLEIAYESNCQLWYAQGVHGNVLVFIAPYRSNAGKIVEKEIIIRKYEYPTSITTKEIQEHVNIFFKYCVSSSINTTGFYPHYLYRQYLIYNDFRYKSTFNFKVIKFLERFLTLAFGGATIWVALYVSGKI